MSTLHNPVNFIPEHYAAVAYLDSQQLSPMEFTSELGFNREAYEWALQVWRDSFGQYFGWVHPDRPRVPFRCDHCGSHLRYVVVVHHAPTDEHICMGETCAERLNLSLDQFKLKCLKEVAKKRRDTAKLGNRKARYLEHNPEVKKVFEIAAEQHIRSSFLDSISSQLYRKGELSDKQRDAVIAHVYKLVDRKRQEEKRARAPVTEGRHQIIGSVLTTKLQEGYYGDSWKVLIEADDGSKYWGTLPLAIDDAKRGDRVELTGTVKASDGDRCFGFYSRPSKARILKRAPLQKEPEPICF